MCRRRSSQAARIAAATLALAVMGNGCQGNDPNRVPQQAASAAQPAGPVAVTAIGRLEPKDGVRRVAGPSRPSVVIAKLLVEEGEHVTAGQASQRGRELVE
jgi:multidrug efflux pump subunit AcrA (membrane-fusion protein)